MGSIFISWNIKIKLHGQTVANPILRITLFQILEAPIVNLCVDVLNGRASNIAHKYNV